jgi:hypothetical protein
VIVIDTPNDAEMMAHAEQAYALCSKDLLTIGWSDHAAASPFFTNATPLRSTNRRNPPWRLPAPQTDRWEPNVD